MAMPMTCRQQEDVFMDIKFVGFFARRVPGGPGVAIETTASTLAEICDQLL